MTMKAVAPGITSDVSLALLRCDNTPLSEYSPVVEWFRVFFEALPSIEIHSGITDCLGDEE